MKSFVFGMAPAMVLAMSQPTVLEAHSATAVHVAETPAAALEVVDFWKQAGPALWFAKDPAFDARFRDRFSARYAAAVRGDLAHWAETSQGALALLILLDQYPRNSFRGTPRMYATDGIAREVADATIAAALDRDIPPDLRLFIYLPFAHSENLADQERSVALARTLSANDVTHAEHHRDIIRRFGRFPHRNAILGRVSTREERDYLDNGGYQG